MTKKGGAVLEYLDQIELARRMGNEGMLKRISVK